MAWYNEANFYHIYPLGLCGAPKQNSYGEPVHRLQTLKPWIDHIEKIGFNALYIGPLFESVGHGYETTDYKKLDSRLGDNDDLKDFVAYCHSENIKVIFDGVFNHTGRDFFAFKDVKQNRENSAYKDWYCNVNFWGNTEYNDGFSYENWGGYNLLVKLNQRNNDVKNYICDVIRYWVKEFDVDGIRLDAADVLDFDFMKALRRTANEVKPDFWLMGEVIHGDYTRWINEGELHSVTNYHLHKALYSGHNDHNYFEIAHTVKRLYDMSRTMQLYNFTDNHDVERIYTKLNNKAHFVPAHILEFTLPGIPSVYYGSEFGIEGRKEYGSDDSLRPYIDIKNYADSVDKNANTKLISRLCFARNITKAFAYGDYKQLLLTNRQYAFSRCYQNQTAIVTVNNDDSDYVMTLECGNCAEYIGVISGERVSVVNSHITVNVRANSGDIWLPADCINGNVEAITPNNTVNYTDNLQPQADIAENIGDTVIENTVDNIPAENTASEIESRSKQTDIENTESVEAVEIAEETDNKSSDYDAGFAAGRIAGLQEAILSIMERNGYVTEQMRRDVYNQTHIPSLITWVKSFR